MPFTHTVRMVLSEIIFVFMKDTFSHINERSSAYQPQQSLFYFPAGLKLLINLFLCLPVTVSCLSVLTLAASLLAMHV